MKKIFIYIIIFNVSLVLFSDTHPLNPNIENNISKDINDEIRPYVLDKDKTDLLAGGSITKIEYSEDKKYKYVTENETYLNSIEIFDHHVDYLIKRGFYPDMVIYYSNDSKSTDNIILYQDNKAIFTCKYAYRAYYWENQNNLIRY